MKEENQNVQKNSTEASSQPVASNQPIVNTEAVKAKTSELAGKAKNVAGNVADKTKNIFAAYKEKLKTDKRVLYGSIGVGAVVVVLLLVFIITTLFDPAKAVVRKYANAMVDMDAGKIVELYHEDYLENGYFDEDGMEEMLDAAFEALEDKDYYYKKFKIDSDYKKYDKDDVEDLAEALEESYDIDEKDVQAARRYTIRFTVDDDGDKDDEKIKITVVKIDGKWYLTNED